MASPNTIVNRLREPAKRIIPRRLRAPLNRAYFSAISLYYRGGDHWCPCCGRAVKAFLPYSTYGKAPVPNAQCPSCGALARHRLAWQFLRASTDLGDVPQRLLHFAPEPILQQRLGRLPGLDYVSADLDSPLAMVQLDITNIPAADGAFDAILCSHVLAHVPDDRRATAELRRVLRPGGWVVIQTDVGPAPDTYEDASARTADERLAAYGQADLWRVYGRDLGERLEDAGFRVAAIGRDDVAGQRSADEMGLDDECLYHCVRPG